MAIGNILREAAEFVGMGLKKGIDLASTGVGAGLVGGSKGLDWAAGVTRGLPAWAAANPGKVKAGAIGAAAAYGASGDGKSDYQRLEGALGWGMLGHLGMSKAFRGKLTDTGRYGVYRAQRAAWKNSTPGSVKSVQQRIRAGVMTPRQGVAALEALPPTAQGRNYGATHKWASGSGTWRGKSAADTFSAARASRPTPGFTASYANAAKIGALYGALDDDINIAEGAGLGVGARFLGGRISRYKPKISASHGMVVGGALGAYNNEQDPLGGMIKGATVGFAAGAIGRGIVNESTRGLVMPLTLGTAALAGSAAEAAQTMRSARPGYDLDASGSLALGLHSLRHG